MGKFKDILKKYPLARKIVSDATNFLSKYYTVSAETLLLDVCKYLETPVETHLDIIEFMYRQTKDYHDRVAHEIHEMAEAQEVKRVLGQFPKFASKEHWDAYKIAHPIATAIEQEYFNSLHHPEHKNLTFPFLSGGIGMGKIITSSEICPICKRPLKGNWMQRAKHILKCRG